MVDILISYGCIFFSLGGVPPSRWIVNYDFDLLDGLVIGAVLGAHMPFLVGEILLIPIHVLKREELISAYNWKKHPSEIFKYCFYYSVSFEILKITIAQHLQIYILVILI